MIRRGVVGFKSFMIHSGVDEFHMVEDTHIRNAMSKLAQAESEGLGRVPRARGVAG